MGRELLLDARRALIESCELLVRGQKLVKRNARRFPEDFMFQLTQEEAELSRSQFAILNSGRGGNIEYLPHAFPEHGAIRAPTS